MRVIIVANGLYSGGAEKQILWIARTLVEQGVPCAVFELQAKPVNERLANLIDNAMRAGVEFRRAAPTEGYATTWLRLQSFVRGHETAIVWTWGFRSDFTVLLLHWLRLKRRWICSLRTAHKSSFRSLRHIVNACIAQGASYVANTNVAREYMEEVSPKSRTRCEVLYNFAPESTGEPIALAQVRPQPLRVVMLGNIDFYKKGHDYTLELATLIRDEELPIVIHVAGRADREGRFAAEIKARKLSNVLIYQGETGTPQAFLRTGHCFLLMSRVEGMPNALLEATSLGLPVITTAVGDLGRLVVDRTDMFIVPPVDVKAIKERLLEIIENWPEAIVMGLRGRQWSLRNFSADVCSRNLMRILSDAATRPRMD